MTPPRLATWLLERRLDPDAAESIGGDLIEEFGRRAAAHGERAARRWYTRQALSVAFFRQRPPGLTESPDLAESRRSGRRLLDGIRRDLQYALRMIRSAPAFGAIAVLTLAIGIGAATIIGTAADRALVQTLPYPHADRFVVAGSADRNGEVGNVGFETALDWRARVASFESLTLIRGWFPSVADESGAERLSGMRVSWNYFRMLGVRPALGRDLDESDDTPAQANTVMLSDGLWRRRYNARRDIVGSTIMLNGAPFLVAGVMPASFEDVIAPHFYAAADAWAPLGYAIGGSSSCRSCEHLKALAVLRPGVTAARAQAELASVQTTLRIEHPADYAVTELPVVAPLADEVAGQLRRPLQVLMGAVAFLLLVACANVAGLLVARATDRERELALRSALGAGRGRIVRQLLTESFVLAALATMLGVALARWGLATLAASEPRLVPRLGDAAADPALIVIGGAVAAIALAVFGLLPAWTSARRDLQSVLREGRQSSGRRALRAREILMTVEVAIALVLVAGAGLMYRSVDRLLAINPGFESADVTAGSISLVGPRWAKNEPVLAFQDEVVRRMRALPGIDSVAFAGQIPLGGNYDRRGFHVEGRVENSADAPEVELYGVSPDYFRVLRIPLRRGRLISDDDRDDTTRVMVIGEATAKQVFPREDPIGRRVQFGGTNGPFWTIVGVVGDVRHYHLDEPPTPQMYVPEHQSADSFPVIVVRASAPAAEVAAAMRREIAAVAADVPVSNISTLDDLVRGSIATRRFLMVLLAGFAATALLLAAVGLYGVVAQGVSSRRREFGIRLALGASSADVFRLVLGRGVQLVGLGVIAGLIASAWLGRLLGSQLYATTSHDPLALSSAIAVLVVAALAAHVVPARRAIRVDPSITLRND